MSFQPDPARTFVSFVVGAPNQLAAAAARALADLARPPFNPLYLLGEPGQGKTHLLQAIGAQRLTVAPGTTVELVTWGGLSEQLLEAAASGRSDVLRPCREAGLLLLDDVDRMTQYAVARRPILDLLDARLTRGLATAMAGRRPPGALLGPEDPAVRLLGAGLVVEIGPPDAALREEIVRWHLGAAGVSFAQAVVDEVVGLPLGSAADLVAAVQRLIAFQTVSPTPLAPSQARVLITGVLEEPFPVAVAAGVPAADAAAPPGPAPARGLDEGDEFGSFLSEVVAGISHQVDRWRTEVGDAVLRFEAAGYHTARLEALLDQELPAQPEQVLARYEADVARLEQIAAEVRAVAPDLGGHEVLRDPDRVEEAEQLLEEARTRDLSPHRPDPGLRLDDLIEGPSNRAALDAVRALVARAPGATALCLVGDPGTGKSHLLHGLGNALAEAGTAGVVCVSAQTLAREIEDEARAGRLGDWRRRHRWIGALLVDDVHLLGERREAQEVLLELVDQLGRDGRPVAVTAAIPVAELEAVEPQLLARLASGAVVDLPRPDREVRLGLVLRWLDQLPARPASDLAAYIAGRPAGSVRAVQVMLQRVLRQAAAAGSAPDVALARQVLEGPPGAGRLLGARPGVLGPSVAGPRLREKLIERWPEARDLLTEELS